MYALKQACGTWSKGRRADMVSMTEQEMWTSLQGPGWGNGNKGSCWGAERELRVAWNRVSICCGFVRRERFAMMHVCLVLVS